MPRTIARSAQDPLFVSEVSFLDAFGTLAACKTLEAGLASICLRLAKLLLQKRTLTRIGACSGLACLQFGAAIAASGITETW